VERISDAETRLLKAFYNYAESNQRRLARLMATKPASRSASTCRPRRRLFARRSGRNSSGISAI
jgi:hypothetical protein